MGQFIPRPESLAQLVSVVRGEKVLLDSDLADLYGVTTKALNQAVKRNQERFPADFMFQLSTEEWTHMRSQTVTASRRNVTALPYAFTEQGVAMLSSVLRSQRAAEVNRHPEQGELPLEDGNPELEGGNRRLRPLPQGLAERLPKAGQRLSGLALQALICDLCEWHALRGEELATLMNKDLKYLRNKHLSVLIQSGKLVFLYPESPNHALQAYKRA